ncbi:MAG: hypothetical protein R2701_12665 [Acidimicrobiales bacterium]
MRIAPLVRPDPPRCPSERRFRRPAAPPPAGTGATGPLGPAPFRPCRESSCAVRTIRRSIALVVLLAMLVGVIAVRLVNVQVVSSERYLAYGDSQRDASRPIPASRGSIYDRNGQALALSVAQLARRRGSRPGRAPRAHRAALASIVDVPRSGSTPR